MGVTLLPAAPWLAAALLWRMLLALFGT